MLRCAFRAHTGNRLAYEHATISPSMLCRIPFYATPSTEFPLARRAPVRHKNGPSARRSSTEGINPLARDDASIRRSETTRSGRLELKRTSGMAAVWRLHSGNRLRLAAHRQQHRLYRQQEGDQERSEMVDGIVTYSSSRSDKENLDHVAASRI